MQHPNVLFLVWDACRVDAAREDAPTLQSLADSGLWFENAITAGGTSLPSHTSMVTGQYPHEHGTYAQHHTIEGTPLVAELGERGYTRYGVSANGFASPMYGFDRDFDHFYNTQGKIVYPQGLDLYAYARRIREEHGGHFDFDDVDYTAVLRSALGHDHPLKSLANLAGMGLSTAVGRYDWLRRIPHPRFERYSEFAYSPSKNTELLTSIIEEHADSDEPFFAFANYMDPHHPYAPPKARQREYCGRTFSQRELSTLAAQTHPHTFLEQQQAGEEFTEETLAAVRGLYRGEVRTADEHLARILDALDRAGLREETLVVVTADHGENLGETDAMGETRFGHVFSASDELFRVPLVVSHPALEARRVEEYVSLKNLATLFTDGLQHFLDTRGRDVRALTEPDGVVTGQLPATVNDAMLQKYPDLAEELDRHLVAAYGGGWKVVLSSRDDAYAWVDGEERPVADAPDAVVQTCREHLDRLVATSERGELGDAEVSHLEALGYL